MSVREHDQKFWAIVDNGGIDLPPELPEFDHGGRGNFPSWSTHLAAFLFGGITFCALIFTPMFVPVIALVGVIGVVAVAVRRRWR